MFSPLGCCYQAISCSGEEAKGTVCACSCICKRYSKKVFVAGVLTTSQ